MKQVFRWLGVAANARAITGLLSIGAVLGGLTFFVLDKLLPIYSPGFAANTFGEGYRRGKREAELEQQVQQLKAVLDAMRQSEEIRLEVENMSDEEIAKELAGNGELRD